MTRAVAIYWLATVSQPWPGYLQVAEMHGFSRFEGAADSEPRLAALRFPPAPRFAMFAGELVPARLMEHLPLHTLRRWLPSFQGRLAVAVSKLRSKGSK